MLCPQCKVELRIKNSYTEVVDGIAQTVQELHCANPSCSLKSNSIPVKVLVHAHKESVPDKLVLCSNCGMPLARESKKGYKIHESAKQEDGFVICPLCNTAVTIG